MTDIQYSGDDIAIKKKRQRAGRKVVRLPNGEEAVPREQFAKDDLGGVNPRTVQRMNLPTIYIAGVAHVLRNAALKIIAASARRRNETPQRRRGQR